VAAAPPVDVEEDPPEDEPEPEPEPEDPVDAVEPELAVVEDPEPAEVLLPLLPPALPLPSPVPRVPPVAEFPLAPWTVALLALEAKSETVSPVLQQG
jgi:hypothetical protein